MAYKFVEHTADIMIKVETKSLEKAFEESALALKETILGRKLKVSETIKKELKVNGHDLERLLYNFLEEFIYLLEAGEFILSKIEILKISKKDRDYNLIARIKGDNSTNYKYSNNVKAITYSDMSIKQGEKVKINFVIDV